MSIIRTITHENRDIHTQLWILPLKSQRDWNFGHRIHGPSVALSTRSGFRFSFLPSWHWTRLTTIPKRTPNARLVSHYLGIIEIRTFSYSLFIVGIIDYAMHGTRSMLELNLWIHVKTLIAHKKQKISKRKRIEKSCC